jgi:hypothetical protein
VAAGSCSISFATAATIKIMAAYAGDSNFNSGNSAQLTQQVNNSTH